MAKRTRAYPEIRNGGFGLFLCARGSIKRVIRAMPVLDNSIVLPMLFILESTLNIVHERNVLAKKYY